MVIKIDINTNTNNINKTNNIDSKSKSKTIFKDKIVCNFKNDSLNKTQLGFIIISNQQNTVNSKKILLNKTSLLLKDDEFPLFTLDSEINQDIVQLHLSKLIKKNFNIEIGKLRNVTTEQIFNKKKCFLYLVYIPTNINNIKYLFPEDKMRNNISLNQYQKSYCWRTFIDLFTDQYDSLYHNILISRFNTHLNSRFNAASDKENDSVDNILNFNLSLSIIYTKLINLFL